MQNSRHNQQTANLHCHWFFELPLLLNAEHQIASVDIFHYKIESILNIHATILMAIL